MKAFVGELIGTFVLTLFGCGSVVVAVLFGEYGSIFQIALVWGDWRYARYLLNPAFIMRAFESGRYSGHGAE